jgi:hypothetical protein
MAGATAVMVTTTAGATVVTMADIMAARRA